MLNCILAFSTLKYLISSYRCPRIMSFYCADLQQLDQSIWACCAIIGIRARSTWRCLQSNSIFRNSMVSSISTCDRLWWTPSWLRAGWRKHYSRRRKSLKHKGRNLAGVRWENIDCYSALLDGRSVGWVFFRENNILAVEATSRSLSEEVIGDSIDFEATYLSSSHAWRYAYLFSYCRIFMYYQWFR